MPALAEQQEIRRGVIVHGYYPENPSPDRPDLDIQGIFTAHAVSELWNQGKVDVLIFPTGAKNPSVAQDMADFIKTINPEIPEEAFKVSPVAATTIDEVAEGKRIADAHGINNITSVGASGHLYRIRHDLLRKYGNAPVVNEAISSERILLTSPNATTYKPLLEAWHATPEADAFAARDRALLRIDRLPFGEQILRGIDHVLHGNKGLEIAAGKAFKLLRRHK